MLSFDEIPTLNLCTINLVPSLTGNSNNWLDGCVVIHGPILLEAVPTWLDKDLLGFYKYVIVQPVIITIIYIKEDKILTTRLHGTSKNMIQIQMAESRGEKRQGRTYGYN